MNANAQTHVADALKDVSRLGAGCEAYFTNDKTLRRVTELPILILDDLMP